MATPIFSDRGRRSVYVAGLALLCVACLKGFYDVAAGYNEFLLPQSGTRTIPERELAFYAYYALFGSIGLAALYGLGERLGWEARLRALAQKSARRPPQLIAALALLCFAASFLFRRLWLTGQPIADDESTYLFIARTLLAGRLVNPPPSDPDYFRNQFVVLNDHAWYGKYPIGHPLFLALGEALHVRDLIPPLCAAGSVILIYLIGRRVSGPRRGLFGAALLCVSPHFVLTCGTLLSQPSACMVLLLSTWLTLRAVDGADGNNAWLAGLAGLCFGFGIVVRPLPGGLFALVGATWYFVQTLRAPKRDWLSCCLLAGGVALGVLAVLAVNDLQTGDPFTTGYHEVHGGVRVFDNRAHDLANSLFGGLLRENFWLFGIPASLVPILFARPRRHAGLIWGLIAAGFAYRIVSPKTVVASTGPIYLTEIVPLLALMAADGLWRVRRYHWSAAPRRKHSMSLRLATLTVASVLLMACFFAPVVLSTLHRATSQRALVFRALEQSHASRALVFADALVYPSSALSWAYFPDNPSPMFDDDVLFVRIPQQNPSQSVHEFWQRRFPDRRAFLFMWTPRGEPLFRELEAPR
jgi:hypothetical protein